VTQPIKVNDDLYALPLTTELMNGPTTLNPALILDEQRGLTLVDTGVPGQLDALGSALSDVSQSCGCAARDTYPPRPRPYRLAR